MLIDLDEPSGLDPVRVGSKAASLAAARAAGAPVLGGFVVDAHASRGHLNLGANALVSRGSGGARLVVSGEPLHFAAALVERGEDLDGAVVARSSTLLEASGEWSGAFTSYVDLSPGHLPKAVVGCWASAFSIAALERQRAAGVTPGSWPMAVLIQPSLNPEMGGWAELSTDGAVTVHGVEGSPAALLQGWATGQTASYQGSWSGGLVEMAGPTTLDAIRDALALSSQTLDVNRCEWAFDDRVWLLQLGWARRNSQDPPTRRAMAVISDEIVEVVRSVVEAPGVLGEEVVLPWALAGLGHVEVAETSLGSAPFRLVTRLARELTEEVWGMPWQAARPAAARLMSELRGGDLADPTSTLRRLRRADPSRASLLLGTLQTLRLEMVELGMVADESEAWHLGLEQIEAAREGRSRTVPTRLGMGQWEPLVAHVVLSVGNRRRGSPASPGVGAGRRSDQTGPARSGGRRAILTAGQPSPTLASLLWDASGLVTATGSPAAHLFEAARALRVPAVCGVDIGDSDAAIVAVDGDSGEVATIDLET